MELYKWQIACLDAWERNRYRGIVNVITGAGKTVLALTAAERLRQIHPDLRVRIVVPTIPLAGQWKQAILERAGEEEDLPGFYGGMRKDSYDSRFMIYIINSARNVLSRHIRADLVLHRPVLLICDECHHYQSRENRRIFDFITPQVLDSSLYCSLGLSATPFSDGQEAGFLEKALGREICRYGFSSAVRDRVVSPFMIGQVAADFLPEELDAYEDLTEQIRRSLLKLLHQYPFLKDLQKKAFMKKVTALAAQADHSPEEPAACFLLQCFQRKEISVLAEARTRCCLDLIGQLPRDERILVFCERIEQAEAVTRAIRRQLGTGICGIYHSQINRDARERNLEHFRRGRQRILVSCRCLDEGVDVPSAGTGIVLSGSSVERQRVQRLGRVIRRSAGKDAACLYYIYIRQSADDRAFLTGIPEYRRFDLRYLPTERTFSNDLYEYAALDLLSSASSAGMTAERLGELRSCLLSGLPRADYLLPPAVQVRNAAAGTVRQRNYWHVMHRLGAYFRTEEEQTP
ncbi:MAG: DEAD/DEAH box helicase [Clostridium sp.]|nr:DEAD/DEAH box helicase [Clostridium sp.]